MSAGAGAGYNSNAGNESPPYTISIEEQARFDAEDAEKKASDEQRLADEWAQKRPLLNSNSNSNSNSTSNPSKKRIRYDPEELEDLKAEIVAFRKSDGGPDDEPPAQGALRGHAATHLPKIDALLVRANRFSETDDEDFNSLRDWLRTTQATLAGRVGPPISKIFSNAAASFGSSFGSGSKRGGGRRKTRRRSQRSRKSKSRKSRRN